MKTIKQQLNYVITESCEFGRSKKNDKNNGLNKNHDKIYSIEDAKGLRDTAKNFSNWLEQYHPEITKIKQLNKDIVQEWIDNRSVNWSNRTKKTHCSHMEKINRLVNKNLESCRKLDFTKELDYHIVEHKQETKIRDVEMSREDLDKLLKSFSDSRSQAYHMLVLSSCLGLRALEVASFRIDYIDLDNSLVHLPSGSDSGTKGGRARDIIIQDRYFPILEYFTTHYCGKCFTINEDSYNKTIRRHLKDLELDEKYKNTTNHAIRKLWAHELYNSYVSSGMPDSIKTFDLVSSQLGHGTNREDLYKTYILK